MAAVAPASIMIPIIVKLRSELANLPRSPCLFLIDSVTWFPPHLGLFFPHYQALHANLIHYDYVLLFILPLFLQIRLLLEN